MKRCPACSKTYEDSASFCLDDAQALIGVTADTAIPESAISKGGAKVDSFIGSTLNKKFRIDALLGRGGMGAVYRATDTVLDRTVAVKLLRQDLLGDENLDSRFLREARAAARIEHPNAVTVHDFGTLPEGSAFIVMEFIQGLSLRDLLKRGGAVQPGRAIDLMKQACSAVAAAHQVGVIHRDLKPENIMLKDVGVGLPTVKVVDFGLAKLKESASQSLANLTSKGEIIGTPYYMSPEQCAGGDIDERTDIYSLGIIFYEMLMGRPPFTGTPAAVIGMHLYKAIARLDEVNPNITTPLSDIVLEMLKKEKEQRPSSLGIVLRQLDGLQLLASQVLASGQLNSAASDLVESFPSGSNGAISSDFPAPTKQKAETLKLKDQADNPELAPPISSTGARTGPALDPLSSQLNSSKPTLIAAEALSTQERPAETAQYNTNDFQTRPSEPLTRRPSLVTNDLSSPPDQSATGAATGITGAIPPTNAIPAPRASHKRLYLAIGVIGVVVGVASVFFIPTAKPGPAKPTPTVNKPANEKPSPTVQPTPQPAQPEQNPEDQPVGGETGGDNHHPRQPRKDDRGGGVVSGVKQAPGKIWRAITGKKEKKNRDD